MNILILQQHFNLREDDRPGCIIQAGRELASRGHCVYVITGNSAPAQPLGKKKIGLFQKDGLAIIVLNIPYKSEMKAPDKIRNLAAYARKALLQGRRLPRPELIIAASPPLTAAAPAISLSRRFGAPLILVMGELWPDALIRRGTLKHQTLIKLARRLEQKAYAAAAAIVALSPAVADSLKRETACRGKIHIIGEDQPESERACRFIRVLEGLRPLKK